MASDCDFIEAEGLDDYYERLNKDGLVVFTGMTGVGKTTTANQLAKKIQADDSTAVVGVFNCASKENLIHDMGLFSSEHGLRQTQNHTNDLGQELEKVVREFFRMVNKSSPNSSKCFIFDDAELNTRLIKLIDSIVYPTASKNRWKVIVTTQDADPRWLNDCENVPKDPFIILTGFTTNDVLKLFRQSSNRRGADKVLLDESMAENIIERFGQLPVILQLVKSEIQAKPLSPSIMEILKSFEAKINDADKHLEESNKALATVFYSLRRVAEQSGHPEKCKELMSLVTMLDEKYLMAELLFSCAEVIVQGIEEPKSDSNELANSLVWELQKRFLCCEGQRLFVGSPITISLCKLVKQSMMLFRDRRNATSELAVSQKALLAVTRVMPKDGRGHESHAVYRYMYNHGRALENEITKQEDKKRGHVNKTATPEILMMCADLSTAMGYCQLAFRSHIQHSTEHFDKAFNFISQVIAKCRYDELEAGEKRRVEILYEAGREMSLHENDFYKNVLVPDLPYYEKVTEKDLPNMLPSDADKPMLQNGHLCRVHVQKMINAGKVLPPECLAELYPLELLAELYSIKSKAYEFQLRKTDESEKDRNLLEESYEFAKAGVLLYEKIRAKILPKGFCLLGELILRRLLLKYRRYRAESSGNEVNPRADLEAICDKRRADLEAICDKWRKLQEFDMKAVECGLMRTDFGRRDRYHLFLCEEEETVCRGMLAVLSGERAALNAVEKSFTQLLNIAKDEFNQQTLSKTYRHYSYFLWKGKYFKEAIKALLDSMINLHNFLRCKDKEYEFPEQRDDCGKFDSLLYQLNEYCSEYKSDEPILREGQSDDDNRIRYLAGFHKCWDKLVESKRADKSKKFHSLYFVYRFPEEKMLCEDDEDEEY